MDQRTAKIRIRDLIGRFARARSRAAYRLVPTEVTDGKLYEAYVLSLVLERLVRDERFDIRLINSNFVVLKSSPGPINRNYPYFVLTQNGTDVAELWTDVEFLSLSYVCRGAIAQPALGEFHELDILVTDPGIIGRPRPNQVWMGVECKHTDYDKSLLREILGVRRELSFLTDSTPTAFRVWPSQTVPATPASCLVVYTTSEAVNQYSSSGDFFGIKFIHQPI